MLSEHAFGVDVRRQLAQAFDRFADEPTSAGRWQSLHAA